MNRWLVDKKFRATVEKAEDWSLTGFVEEVTAPDETEEEGNTWEYFLYLKFYLRWDGCCHIYFGEEGDNPGYLHFCGKESFDKHCRLMKELFEWSVEMIPRHMDREEQPTA